MPTAPPRLHYAWVVLVVGTLVVTGALGLARFGYSIVLPSMQEGLELNNTQTGFLASANLAGYVAFAAIGGALASRLGARSVASGGLLVAAVGMLLTGLAGGFSDAAGWRFLTGLGSGAANVSAMGMLAAWFAARRRGLAAGVAVAGSSLALIALGPMVPRVLRAYGDDGWRVCWFIFAGSTLSIAVASLILLRNRPSDLGLDALGSSEDRSKRSAGLSTDGSAAKSAWRDIYLSIRVWHLGLVYSAFGFSYIIYMTFFTKHLMAAAGYTPQQAGALFMTMGWASLPCGFIWGSVSDRIGRKGALILVYLIQSAAFGLFAWPAPPALFVSALLFGITAWSIPAIMAAACGDVLGARMAPAALGFITVFFGIGQALGPTVAGAIADAAGSFGPAFALAAGVALAGAAGAATLRAGGSPPAAPRSSP